MMTVSTCFQSVTTFIGSLRIFPLALRAILCICSVDLQEIVSFICTPYRAPFLTFTRSPSSTFSVLFQVCSVESRTLLYSSRLFSSLTSVQLQSCLFTTFLYLTPLPSTISYCSGSHSRSMTSTISTISTPLFVRHCPICTSNSDESIICTC